VEGREVKVQFWDTAGQEKYNNVAEQYYRKADGAIIVASCDKPVKQAVS
jgi:small GTP-binding protein